MSFLFVSWLFLLFYSTLEATGKDKDPDRLINLLDHLKHAIYEGSHTMNTNYLHHIVESRVHSSRLSKYVFPLSELPRHPTCYDWRHYCFEDDYFPYEKSNRNFKIAAMEYKKIIKTANMLKDIIKKDEDAMKCYLRCWLGDNISLLEQDAFFKFVIKIPKRLLVKDIDENEIFALIKHGDKFPGVTLENNLSLNNPLIITLFVYDHSLIKHQTMDFPRTLKCLAIGSKMCPCKRWVSYIQPRYTYQMISLIWGHFDEGLDIPSDSYLLQLLAIIISEKDTEIISMEMSAFENPEYLPKLVESIMKYDSGVQILKDIWPASQFELISFDRASIMALPETSSKAFWSIFYKPKLKRKDKLTVSEDGEYFVLFPSYYKQDVPSKINFEDQLFSIEDREKSLVDTLTHSAESGDFALSKKLLDTKCKNMFSNHEVNTRFTLAIKWMPNFNMSHTPVTTIQTLFTLAKLIRMRPTQQSYEINYVFDNLILSKLLLIGLCYYNSSTHSSRIIYDVLSKQQFTRDCRSIKSVEFKIETNFEHLCLLPFSFSMIKTDDLLAFSIKNDQLLVGPSMMDGICLCEQSKIIKNLLVLGPWKASVLEVPSLSIADFIPSQIYILLKTHFYF